MFPDRYGIYALLILYLLLASVYSVVTPIMEASDELWHYPMVKYIADHWALPIQEPGVETPWRQEGSQPPLYYFISAVLTSWVDTSDLEQIRWLNPHADNGKITQDGNTNLIIHTPANGLALCSDTRVLYAKGVPGTGWQGMALAIRLIRLASVWMGVGTVYMGYLLILELWPDRRGLALAAAAITAFNPMFLFVSGAVNNDNLAMLLCAIGIWLLVKLVKRHGDVKTLPRKTWWKDSIVLGAALGLGVLTKTSALGLLPLTALAVGYVSWKRRSWWHFLIGGATTAGLVALISGWWFARNAILYKGDWLGLQRFIVILGYRVPPATLRQLWGERHGFMMAYWGLFGGVNVPMPRWVYAILNGALVVSGIGLLLRLGKFVSGFVLGPNPVAGGRDRPSRLGIQRSQADLGAASVSVELARTRGFQSSRLGPVFDLKPLYFQLLLLLLWPIIVLVSWAGWATKTWSSQGRLVFSAISAWSAWMAMGLGWLLPLRWSRLPPGLLSAFMFGVAVWVPFGVIGPAYCPPILATDTEPTPAHLLQADVGGKLRLLGYDMEGLSPSGEVRARPGEAVRFTLYWEAQNQMQRDWSVFCHILDLDLELPIAVRDRYPGQGLLATSLMEPGLRWVDPYVIWLPETTYAPSRATLEIGLYDVSSGERPPLVLERGDGAQVVGNALRFQPLRIEPKPGVHLPNPLPFHLEDKMALVGWDVDRRVVAAGEAVQLTLYWECLAPMKEAYTVSAQVVRQDRRKAAQSDMAPGGVATTDWEKGQQIVDRRELLIEPGTPPGGYEIIISVYWWETPQELKRLRVIDDQGYVLPSDSVVLGKLRVMS